MKQFDTQTILLRMPSFTQVHFESQEKASNLQTRVSQLKGTTLHKGEEYPPKWCTYSAGIAGAT